MSIEAIHYVMKTDIPDGIAKLVAFVIADYAHSETGQAWPKIETLARKCSQSVRTVQRKVRVLEEMGVLRVEQRHAETGRQRENLFVLYLPGVPRPAANDVVSSPTKGQPRRGEGDTQSPIPPPNPVTPEGVRPVTPEGDTAVTPRGIHQKESPKGIPSEPIGSAPQGGPAPRNFHSDLRSRGVETLRDLTGWTTARAHSRIGQWLSEAGDDAGMVLAVIDEAVEAKPIDASGWITARLKRRKAEAAPAHQSPRHPSPRHRPANGALSILADVYGVPDDPRPLYDQLFGSPAGAGHAGNGPVRRPVHEPAGDATERLPAPTATAIGGTRR